MSVRNDFASMIVANKKQLRELTEYLAREIAASGPGVPTREMLDMLLRAYFHHGKSLVYSRHEDTS